MRHQLPKPLRFTRATKRAVTRRGLKREAGFCSRWDCWRKVSRPGRCAECKAHPEYILAGSEPVERAR